MDTSKEYIKMCSFANELQREAEKNWKALRPSYIYDLTLERVCIYMWLPKTLREKLNQESDEHIVSIESNNDGNIFIPEGTEGGVYWLPRQDQLQSFLEDNAYWKTRGFYEFLDSRYLNKDGQTVYTYFSMKRKDCLASMEQLWLAFVMKEKHNKIWTGENWEKKSCE